MVRGYSAMHARLPHPFQRDRPLRAPGLGVWNRLFDALTLAAMLSNAMLMSQLLTRGSSVAALAALPSAANATTTTAAANATAAAAAAADDDVYPTGLFASDVYANATAADTYADAAGCAALTEGVREVSAAEEAMLRLAMPMALLLFFLLLRGLIGHLVPATPRWLALLHRRRAHFEQHGFDSAKLQAAVREGQQATRGRSGRALLELLYALLCAGPAALWRRRGGLPAVPEWHATGRTEEDERAEAALDAKSFEGRGADDEVQGALGWRERLQQKLFATFATIGLLSTELL